MDKKVEVVKGHVNTIIIDGKLEGIIYHDMQKHSQIIYKCVEMEEEDIVSLIQNV